MPNKNFGRQHRDRQRRDTRAQWSATTQGFYEPSTTGCPETRQEYELDDPDFRLMQRLIVCDNKLVEYAIVLTRFQAERWVEVYSVDTRHGTLHEHKSGHQRSGDRRDVRPLYTQVDVQESFDDPAMEMVLEKYRRMRN